MALVVFDFDKTLTYRDTLFGFYKELDGSNILFPLKRVLLFFVAILFKLKILSNDHLKRFGVWMFIKGRSKFEIDSGAAIYARKIELNKIYKEIYLAKPLKSRIIISASFQEYLKHLFPNETVIGAQLKFKNGVVSGLEKNMFGLQKKKALEDRGQNRIEEFYTDSYSDLPLMKMSKRNFLIEGDRIFEL